MIKLITAKKTTLKCFCSPNNKKAIAWTDRFSNRPRYNNAHCLDCIKDAAKNGTDWTDWFREEARVFLEDYDRGPNLKMTAREIKVLLSGIHT